MYIDEDDYEYYETNTKRYHWLRKNFHRLVVTTDGEGRTLALDLLDRPDAIGQNENLDRAIDAAMLKNP
jgi:hypothetical protein